MKSGRGVIKGIYSKVPRLSTSDGPEELAFKHLSNERGATTSPLDGFVEIIERTQASIV